MPITMLLFSRRRSTGKPIEAPNIEAVTGTTICLNRLTVTDRETRLRFLVDMGADVSVLPKSTVGHARISTRLKLYTASGITIATYGTKKLIVNLNLR